MNKRLTLGRVEIQGCSKSYGAHLKDAIEEDELGRRGVIMQHQVGACEISLFFSRFSKRARGLLHRIFVRN